MLAPLTLDQPLLGLKNKLKSRKHQVRNSATLLHISSQIFNRKSQSELRYSISEIVRLLVLASLRYNFRAYMRVGWTMCKFGGVYANGPSVWSATAQRVQMVAFMHML